MSEISTIHMVPWSVSGHADFQSSFVIFEQPISKVMADTHPQAGRVMLETLDMSIEEEASLLQTMRATFG